MATSQKRHSISLVPVMESQESPVATSQKRHTISLGPVMESQESLDVSFPVRLIVPEDREKQEKKAVCRIDIRILPFMTLIFLLAFLDRAGGGNAMVGGMQKDFQLTNSQYQYCITVLFVPYMTSELPSTLLLRKIGPNVLIPAFVTLWGFVLIVLGVTKNAEGLITVKSFLGVLQWPMAPSIVCYLSGFYTRKELSVRIAVLFSTASLTAALSDLIKTPVLKGLNGFGGKPAWAWIFILGGIFTIGNGIAGFSLIPATPRDAKFLSPEQKELIMARLERDRPSIIPADKFSLGEISIALNSPHVAIVHVLLLMVGTAQFGVAMSLPATVNELGFIGTQGQLIALGPFVLGFFATLRAAYVSDYYNSRGITTAAVATVAMAGYATFFATSNKFVAYGSLYLIVPGMYATTPILIAWLANNSEPYYRQATSVALGFTAANAGCHLSTWLFSSADGPKYRKIAIVNLIFSICIVLGSLLNVVYLSWRNKSKKPSGRRDALLEKYNEDEDGGLRAWIELGDGHPDFLYTL